MIYVLCYPPPPKKKSPFKAGDFGVIDWLFQAFYRNMNAIFFKALWGRLRISESIP